MGATFAISDLYDSILSVDYCTYAMCKYYYPARNHLSPDTMPYNFVYEMWRFLKLDPQYNDNIDTKTPNIHFSQT